MALAMNNQEECDHSTSESDHCTMKTNKKECSATCGMTTTTTKILHACSCNQESSNDDHESLPLQPVQRQNQPSATYSMEQSCWSNTIKQKSKKKVRISKQLDEGFTISRQDMSPHEQSCVWYSEQEYDQISRACIKQIQKLDHGEILKDRKYCARGLENTTYIASIAQKLHRSLAYKVVFAEQDRQRREGVSAPEGIASRYHSVSASSQLWAIAMALTDQRLANGNKTVNSGQWDKKKHSCNQDRASTSCDDVMVVKTSNSSARPFSSTGSIPCAIELARAA